MIVGAVHQTLVGNILNSVSEPIGGSNVIKAVLRGLGVLNFAEGRSNRYLALRHGEGILAVGLLGDVNGFALCVGDRQLVELVAVLGLYGNSNRAALGSRGLVDRNRTVIRLGSGNRGARAGGRAAAAARMMHGKVCGNGGVAVDGKGLRSAALNCLAVYRPTTEVIAAVCGRGEGDFRACCNHAALQAGNLAVLCAGAYAVLVVYCGHSRSVLTVFYRNNGRQCSIVNVDTVVLRVACLARLVGVNNQS